MIPTNPIEHVKVFCAEIGPRGPTTEAEARAAAYAAAKLEEAGVRDVSVETFRSVPSLWWALDIALVLALGSTVFYYGAGGAMPVVPIAFILAALYVVVAELSFWKLSLSNFLPKKISQNVYGKIPPISQPLKKVVVIGHLDTNRTPLLFHPRLVQYLPGILAVVVVCVVLKIPVIFIGRAMGAHTASLLILLALDVPLVILLAVMLHGDLFSPFTEGANDNATAAAVVLSLAEQFANEPLECTEFRPLCTGCEEAGLTGIKAFLNRHGDELKNAYFIDLECLGIGKLSYVTYEGMLKKYFSDGGLVRAANDAASSIDGLDLSGIHLKSGYTETAIVLKEGFKGITIMAMPEGCDDVPHWHQVSDRIQNIDPGNLTMAVRYVAALARELDSE